MKAEIEKRIGELLANYPTKRAALLPALWLVQEKEGWVSPEASEEIAKILKITPDEVKEVVSFYTLFSRRPIDKPHIQVCVGLCCKLRGAEAILSHLKESGEGFHISTVECLGSCGTAPMMQIGNDYYEDLTIEKVDKILSDLKNG
jgi:NADH:ubiquinone oxidoreductase subunit E